MTEPRRFDPRELEGVDPALDGAEVAAFVALARELGGASAGVDHAPLPSGFEDGVMAALADEPPPRLVARGRSPAAILATIGAAWRIATTGPRPTAVRAQALALVLLAVVAGLSVGSLAAVGAARLLSSDASPQPSFVPLPSPSAVGPSPSPMPSPSGLPSPSVLPSPSASELPSPSAMPSPSASPSASAEPAPSETVDATRTPRPTETPEATETAKPTDTPEPTETDDPDDTPEPSGTDDHSGPGGGEEDDHSGPSGG